MSRIDFVAYPPTSFPFRDLLVLEQLPLGPEDTVCEIGVGSGGTTARLARICRSVTGFEISRPTVDAIRYLEGRHANLRFVVADVTRPADLRGYEGAFSRLVACDTLEHVPDAEGFFRGAATLLRRGGELLVTFPNEPRDKMHGVTRFDAPADLTRLLDAAGFEAVRVGAARLAPRARRVADALGWRPIELVRTALRRGRGAGGKRVGESSSGASSPQTFEATHFYKRMAMWRRLSPAVNAYWWGVLQLMDATGPVFDVDGGFRDEPFTDCQVLVTAVLR